MSLGAGAAGLLTHRVVHTYIYIDTSCIRLISEASSWCRGTPAFKEMFAFVFNLKSGFPISLMWEKIITKYIIPKMEPLGGLFHSILKFEKAAKNFIQCFLCISNSK